MSIFERFLGKNDAGEDTSARDNSAIVEVESEIESANGENEIIQLTDDLLLSVRDSINKGEAVSFPIAMFSKITGSASFALPAISTVAQVAEQSGGLYRITNMSAGDVLSTTKAGKTYGFLKNANGGSKCAQLKEVGAINPSTIMIAAAIMCIEKEVGKITDMQKEVLSILEIEKQAEIEADVETLTNIVTNYKHNYDNELFVQSKHKEVSDIKRTARKNIIGYQKKVSDAFGKEQLLVMQKQVNTKLSELQKNFKYYRLSLYTYAFASTLEVMLSGNYKEEYIAGIKNEIKAMSDKYRELFSQCSKMLEGMSGKSIEMNAKKLAGKASGKLGELVSNIPIAKDKKIEKYLIEKGEELQFKAIEIKNNSVVDFAKISNPETGIFTDRMEEIIKIYNHTEQICVDGENVYLVG